MLATLITAFSMGLLGAGHCLGMCGGVAGAISFGTPLQSSKTPYLFCYNLGRLLSYAIIGALAGGAVALVSDFKHALYWLRLLSGIMMILLALYIGQFYNALAIFERAGQIIWRYLSPLSKKLLPLKSPYFALPFGFIWGWIPCGMVYSALAFAAVSGNGVIQGFIIMLSFGLGTLPAMLLAGGAGESLKKFIKHTWVRRVSAFILFAYGFFTLYALMMQGHAHSH